ncbi:hypothetical protein CV014_03870 [Nostoc sp. CMAA1605]|nr:hypothetical protein [Nostoc sp. CMAA1605]
MKTVFDYRYLNSINYRLYPLIAQANLEYTSTNIQTVQKIQWGISKNLKQKQQWYSKLEDIQAALELLESSVDQHLLLEAQTNLVQLQQELEQETIVNLLSDPCDQHGAYLTITAGVSDQETDAWANALLQIYYLWATTHLYKVSLFDTAKSDITKVKYILQIQGRYVYGYLKSEQGIHTRIVRISPKNGQGKRLTCSNTI